MAPLLDGGAVVGVDDFIQILLPERKGDFLRRVGLGVGGQLLAVDQMEPGNDLADEGRGLTADVALTVGQQLVQKSEGLGLLGDRQICIILPKNVQVGPELLPALGGAGAFDQIAELALVGQLVHQLQVVFHRQENQPVHRLVGSHKGGVLQRRGAAVVPGQGHVHSLADHVVLKVVELAVYELVPAALGLVHVVQLGQDYLEGLIQGVEDGNFIALGVPVLLAAEVGVNQAQGLHRQGVQLQVPGGVVGGDMADVVHLPLLQPLVGVVVVEVGHPLSGAAAELAQVVGGGGGGNQRQVDFRAGLGQTLGHGQGDVMDSGDMPQSLEGGDLQPQAHQLV